ncbi:hypothetical protein SynRS9915_01032 [Synechococcus sp. RS9915]|nr:hypothetical protein SynRS9915_01032 [Synechococcus sp. RS9915]
MCHRINKLELTPELRELEKFRSSLEKEMWRSKFAMFMDVDCEADDEDDDD